MRCEPRQKGVEAAKAEAAAERARAEALESAVKEVNWRYEARGCGDYFVASNCPVAYPALQSKARIAELEAQLQAQGTVGKEAAAKAAKDAAALSKRVEQVRVTGEGWWWKGCPYGCGPRG